MAGRRPPRGPRHPCGPQARLQTRSPRGSQAQLQTRTPGARRPSYRPAPLGLAGPVTDPQPPGLPGAVTDPQPPGLPGAVTDPQPPGARRPGYRPAAPGAPRRGYRPAAPWGSQARLQTRSPRGSQARLQTRSPRGSQARLQTRSPPGLPGAVTDPQPPGLPGAVTDPQPPPPPARRPSYRPAAPRGSQAQLQTRSPRGSQARLQTRSPRGSQARLQTRSPQLVTGRLQTRTPPPRGSQARLQTRSPHLVAGAVTGPPRPAPPPRPARAPAFLSPLSLRTGRPGSTSGLGDRVSIRAGGGGRGSRWLRRAQRGRLPGRPDGPPAAFVASASAAAAPPPGRRALPAGLCAASGAAAAAGAAGLRGCGAAGLRGCGAAGLRGRARGRRRGAGGEGRPGPRPNMAEVTIDQSKLPGVKEVCRDFAVLEDHTLAHSLQEQEIEHHLASNIQRNRLVQHDLQVAKQLQEEDLKAQAQLQKRYKDLEQQDCEIAQEIQEKLAIEAERRRIQEKKDEDIARLLQEKELQEEKKRKKHFPESSGSSAYGDSCYYENGDQPQSRRARELGSGVSRSCRLQSDGNIVKQRNKKLKHPVENLEELEDHCSSGKFLSSRSLGTLRANPQIDIEQRERKRSDHERRRRPPLPKISGEVFLSTGFDDGEAHSSHRTWNWEKQSRHQDRLSPKSSQKAGLHCKEAVYGRDNGQGEHRERKHRPRTPPFPGSEEQLQLHDTGMKPRMMKEADSAPSRVAHRDQEWYDAEIARKLQEEEILATQVDMRAAQVAQDEEIARLLMAEEKKAYKKAKEREKSSLDKRKHDSDWKPKTTKSAHSKSKESNDPHRSKNDRPARPPPPTMTEAEDLDYTHFTNQHNSTRHFSKSESSHKGFHHKQ
uniref:Coiled-coil domain containing 50 n=1 Tax=Canis lupus familiaris TaxID=9615 RepID=A0A8P0NFQ5_CANLF